MSDSFSHTTHNENLTPFRATSSALFSFSTFPFFFLEIFQLRIKMNRSHNQNISCPKSIKIEVFCLCIVVDISVTSLNPGLILRGYYLVAWYASFSYLIVILSRKLLHKLTYKHFTPGSGSKTESSGMTSFKKILLGASGKRILGRWVQKREKLEET